MLVAACTPASDPHADLPDPNIQLPGFDDGTPNCGALPALLTHLYIGSPTTPSRPMDESFAEPPVDT